MTNRRNLYIVLITLLSAGVVALIVTVSVLPDHVTSNFWTLIAFLIAFLVTVAGLAIVTVFLISLDMTLKALKRENIYNINRDNYFYDLPLFDKCLYNRRRYLLKKEGYMISVSPLKVDTISFSNNHKLISEYYGHISDFIYRYLTEEKTLKNKDVSYCYSHGVFLIYVACDRDKLNEILDNIEKELYAIAKREDIRLFVQPSFGICQSDPKSTAYKLVNRANHARKIGEMNFETVTYFDKATMIKQAQIQPEEVLEALKNNEFVVYYQPKYHLASQKFVSTEALVRWNSPKYGLLSPFQFIEQAENGGLIHNIDMYVFERVCQDLNEARKRGRRVLPCSINFSLYEFYSPNFVSDVLNLIDQYKINPALIEIEITESISSANLFLAITILKKFKDAGLKILMDDFGVGYSNLSSLKKLPIDVIKLDKTFIDDIAIDVRSREIVKFLIAFCKANALEVVAEGVQDLQQVKILKAAKCDVIQGFYYSKPIPKAELTKFLSNNEFERKEFI